MPSEASTGSRVSNASIRNAEMIIKHLSEYLSIRFDHAIRITPILRAIKEDLMFHEIANVRRCLLGEKIYGPVRKVVSDVLVSDIEKERDQVFSPSDQCSIQVELVSHVGHEKVESTRGQLRIQDLKMYYGCINPQLMDFIDLLETWIWWDLVDAVEMVRFEQKLGVIQSVEKKQIPDKLRRRLSLLIHPISTVEDEEGGTPKLNIASDREIIDYEIARVLRIQDRWTFRRKYELGYQFVLKRDEQTHSDQSSFIHQIAERVREYDAIERAARLDDDTRHRYAPVLRINPEKITKEMIIKRIQSEMVDLEKEMMVADDADCHLGPPYNYKEAQLKQIDKWVTELQKKYGETPEQIEAKKVSKPPEPAAEKEPEALEKQLTEPEHIQPLASNTPNTLPDLNL